MTPERWRGVEELYHAASECPPAQRLAFLAEACGADSELRDEVASLLAQDVIDDGLLDQPACPAHLDQHATERPSAGSHFGPYRIEDPISKGGMGEVWKARDWRLDRDVAIKFSTHQFNGRFESEARAIAALNHPNICTIHDVGPNYLVMELVDGPTLDERMARGPIPFAEAVEVARQIAGALGAAHEKGIVHGDLKPVNVKIRLDGSVKVLDFGLATMEGPPGNASSEGAAAPRMIAGTPGYMSPEQVRGEKVDKRADIWAFGVVLYEMVAGRRLFERNTPSNTMAAVLTHEPEWERVPTKLQFLLRRCLEKDPRRRLRDIGDAMPLAEAMPALEIEQHSHKIWAAAAGLFAIFAAVGFFLHVRENPPEQPTTRFNISPPDNYQFGGAAPAIVSPDGRLVVFTPASSDGKSRLWIHRLESGTPQPLSGTENASLPFWSPDSKWIGFFAGGKLKKMPVSGGPAIAIADAAAPRGGTWNQDGVIVFAPTPAGGLLQMPASGGVPRPATIVDAKGRTQRFPWFLPDGRHFVYLLGGLAIRVGSLDSPNEDRTLDDVAESRAIYSQGYLLYLRGKTLVARPFDAKHLAFAGEAVPVAEELLTKGLTGSGHFSASANGVLVYEVGLSDRALTWFDRSGERLGTVGDVSALGYGRFSPDHKTVAAPIRDIESRNGDIWLFDVLRAVRKRFTFDPADDSAPTWSPDGRTIVFHSNRTGNFDLYRKPVDGSRSEELLWADSLVKTPGTFSPDGKYLAYTAAGDPKTGTEIWILPDPLGREKGGAPGAPKPYRFMPTMSGKNTPEFSPRGGWLAYESDESGKNEVYVAPFPGPGSRRQVSSAGGHATHWRPDGKELFLSAPTTV